MTSKKSTLTTRDIVMVIILILGGLIYLLVSPKTSVDPIIETQRMERLDKIKQNTEVSPFETDGCSGNISDAWDATVEGLSKISESFREKYSGSKVPFEDACVRHDMKYHEGEGGYEGRLIADMQLREDIIQYGITNTEEIMDVTGIKSEAEVLFIYETIAEAIYHGVRLAGSPCTDKPYAWGFGYNKGSCD